MRGGSEVGRGLRDAFPGLSWEAGFGGWAPGGPGVPDEVAGIAGRRCACSRVQAEGRANAEATCGSCPAGGGVDSFRCGPSSNGGSCTCWFTCTDASHGAPCDGQTSPASGGPKCKWDEQLQAGSDTTGSQKTLGRYDLDLGGGSSSSTACYIPGECKPVDVIRGPSPAAVPRWVQVTVREFTPLFENPWGNWTEIWTKICGFEESDIIATIKRAYGYMLANADIVRLAMCQTLPSGGDADPNTACHPSPRSSPVCAPFSVVRAACESRRSRRTGVRA